MWSPEELGEDAGPEHPTRRDDVPGRAHQKIREVRPRRQAAHHAVGERGPPHADPDESLEQPLPAEFAPAHAVVGREVLTPYPPLPAGEGELTSFPLSGTERGTGGEDRDEALRQELISVLDRKSTRLNSSHITISYAVFCLKKKKEYITVSTVVTNQD